jgi:ribosomal protein L40E
MEHGGYVCPNCNHWNSLKDLKCGKCGWSPVRRKSFLQKAGRAIFGGKDFTFSKGLAIILIFVAIVTMIILSFMALVSIYWLGSLVITLGILLFIMPWRGHGKERMQGGIVLIGATFMALMGVSIDQGGNPVQNLLLEKVKCKSGESLSQFQEVFSVRPGETIYTRDFFCVDSRGNTTPISTIFLLGFRFAWYILLFYILYGIKSFWPIRESG